MGVMKGCPASAGIDPEAPGQIYCAIRLPRQRGDRPTGIDARVEVEMVAPPARGKTVWGWNVMWHGQGCPASAGIDPAPAGPGGAGIRLPRQRGDRPTWSSMSAKAVAVAPPARG